MGVGLQLPLNVTSEEVEGIDLAWTSAGLNLSAISGLQMKAVAPYLMVDEVTVFFLNSPNRFDLQPETSWDSSRSTWSAGTATVGYQH
jgi:hypothetical protein